MQLMQKALERVAISFRALTPAGERERLVLARAILRPLSRTHRGADRLARLNVRIAETFRLPGLFSYRDWLALYNPPALPLPEAQRRIASISVLLFPTSASLQELRRSLAALRQQNLAPRKVVALCVTRRARYLTSLAARLEHLPVTLTRTAMEAEAQLEGDVLLLKGAPILRPHALAALSASLQNHPAAQAVYADEDQFRGGEFRRPFFKPDRSPVLGRQYDYAGNVTLFRSAFFSRNVIPELQAGGLPSWLADPGIARETVIHLPELLHAEPKPRRLSYLDGADFDRALAERTRHAPSLPSVAIIIPTKDRAGLLRDCVESIFAVTEYDRAQLSVVIVDNGSTTQEAQELLNALEAEPAVTVLRRPGIFNYSFLCNQGAAAADAEILVFLNNDTLIRDPDWIAKLAGATALPSAGVIGCKLLYPDGLVQHAGVVLGIQGLAGHIGIGVAESDGVYFNLANHTREVSAVTGALVAITAALFRRAGGYDERLAVAFNDVALCLACNRLGHQTLCLQSALAFHLEGASRGRDHEDTAKRLRLLQECQQILSVWSGFRQDPFYNPNLSLFKTYELAEPPRHFPALPPRNAAPHILMLSATFQFGSGITVVIENQARGLQARGATVSIGAPRRAGDLAWQEEMRHDVASPEEAAKLAAAIGADIVMVHTPPFFAVFQYLPENIAGLAYDYGEPTPELFPDALERRLVNGAKYAAIRYADRVLAISDAVRDESPISDCGLLPLGNTHLARWNDRSPGLRLKARALRGWRGQLVILNVCRFHEAERNYKGVDFYANLRRAVELLHPEVAALTRFVLAGRGKPQDAAFAAAGGIDVVANPSDEGLIELYHAADIYMNFSRWEGYNLGIGQALAFGLPVMASDIPAHRAFGVPVARSLQEAVQEVVRAFYDPQRSDVVETRWPALQEWEPNAEQLWTEIDLLRARKQQSAALMGRFSKVEAAAPMISTFAEPQ